MEAWNKGQGDRWTDDEFDDEQDDYDDDDDDWTDSHGGIHKILP